MANVVEIVPVRTKREWDDFYLLPWDIYETLPNWIPPLLITVKQTLDTEKHPFWKHARRETWNAYMGTECVGRMMAIVDDNHNKFHEEKTAYWGFFECIDDQEVANKLFAAAEAWARSQGMSTLRGPMNPSTNYECGMQISAFETKPFIMMTQNHAYYPALVEKAGYAKAKDLNAWLLDPSKKFDDRMLQRAKQQSQAAGVVIRSIDMKDFEGEVERILQVYNDAWEKNWGFVPMTADEFRQMAKDMKAIVEPKLLYIAEVNGEVAAFSLWLPDLNQVMEKIPSGKLLPTGLFKLLWHTKVRRTVNRGRILTLGVRQKFRSLGLAPLMCLKYYEEAPALGYPVAECSWILEDNVAMNRGLQMMSGDLYKTYRIYDKTL